MTATSLRREPLARRRLGAPLLLVVVLVTPAAPYTPLGKAYGLAERILSAVLLNVLLLASQFLFFARHRHVIDWARP